MDDGVRIAVDVHFPPGHTAGTRYPVLVELTRYWRSAVTKDGRVIRALNSIDRGLLAHGYVIVKVDVRGSGASFGQRYEEYGPREVTDGYETIDWIVGQPWCDGNVGAYGISYSGTTAELICASKHPALKAVVPGWSDFDVYESPARPYGMFPEKFLTRWGTMVGLMDSNDPAMGGSVRPVDQALLSQAITDHESNPNVSEIIAQAEFRDLPIGKSLPLEQCTSRYWRKQIEESSVPMLVFASWLDAGTADGALMRFQNYRNPQKVVILASNHGGAFHASPLVVEGKTIPAQPSFERQLEMRIAFFDHHLKGIDNEVTSWAPLQFFNMGEEKLKSSESWPPPGTQKKRFYFSENGTLQSSPSANEVGHDEYQVDFGISTGRNNRWMTQMGGPVLNLHDREQMDNRMLTYTSEPLEESVQITGWPTINVQMSSSHEDGAILAYLEIVSPDSQGADSRSHYITEGGLRLMHRKVSQDPDFPSNELYHSFMKSDALPVEPGESMQISFKLWPTSVLVPKGYRIRIAIAGQDDTVFQRIPESGDPVFTVFRNSKQPSFVELPIGD